MDYSESIVTSGFSKYVSQLIKGGSTTMYFALGSGNPDWDEEGVPSPSTSISALIKEVYRQVVDSSKISYVDPSTLQVVSNPTSMIRVEVGFSNNEFYGVVREYGLFAVGATSTLKSGTLITYCDHEKMVIPVDSVYKKYIYINT